MNLGKAIKLCRNQKNLRQAKLAEMAGISVAYLSLLEQGKRDPNFSIVERIAGAMNIPISIIVFLATDSNELKGISQELAEKLSFTALNLISADNNNDASVSVPAD